MRKILLVIGLCLLYGVSFSQYKYSLRVESETLKGKKILFTLLENNNIQVAQRTSVNVKSKLTLITGLMPQPSMIANFSTSVNGKLIYCELAIDSGIHSLNLNIEHNKTPKLIITGFNTESERIRRDVGGIFQRKLSKYRNDSGYSNAHSLPNNLNEEFSADVLEYLKTYPDSFYGLIMLYNFSRRSPTIEWAGKVLEALNFYDVTLRNSQLGKQILAEQTSLINALTKSKSGNQVHFFSVSDINGNKFTNESLLGQNYLIVFSATWCIPCQYQLPELKRIYDSYKSKGLKVIYFNNDDDIIKWKDHVTKNKLTWINVSERLKPSVSKIQKSFGVYAIPTCLLIDRKGKIAYNSDQEDTSLKKLETNISQLYERETN